MKLAQGSGVACEPSWLLKLITEVSCRPHSKAEPREEWRGVAWYIVVWDLRFASLGYKLAFCG